MPIARVNGVQLHYEMHGKGEPLLLIAGLGSHSGVWLAVLPLLNQHFQCIVFDNRGVGRSEMVPGPYTIDQMADDAASLLAHLKISTISVLGYSLGGSVLQSLAIRHGRLLKRIVLLNAFPSYTTVQHAWLDIFLSFYRNEPSPTVRAVLNLPWVFTSGFLADHERLARFIEALAKDPYPTRIEGLEAQAHGLRRYDSRPALCTISTPTLVLVGAEDILTPMAQSIDMASRVPDAVLQVLPRGGHGMLIEYPDETVRAVLDFFRT